MFDGVGHRTLVARTGGHWSLLARTRTCLERGSLAMFDGVGHRTLVTAGQDTTCLVMGSGKVLSFRDLNSSLIRFWKERSRDMFGGKREVT